MRFNTAAYNKAFPRKQNEEKIETVAEKFTPTTDRLKNEPAADPAVEPTADPAVESATEPAVEPTDPDGGGDGD